MEQYQAEKEIILNNVDKTIINRTRLEMALLVFRGGEKYKKGFSKPEYKTILEVIQELYNLQRKYKVTDTKISDGIARKITSTGINNAGKQMTTNHNLDRELESIATNDNLLVKLQTPDRIIELQNKLKQKKEIKEAEEIKKAQELEEQMLKEEQEKKEREIKKQLQTEERKQLNKIRKQEEMEQQKREAEIKKQQEIEKREEIKKQRKERKLKKQEEENLKKEREEFIIKQGEILKAQKEEREREYSMKQEEGKKDTIEAVSPIVQNSPQLKGEGSPEPNKIEIEGEPGLSTSQKFFNYDMFGTRKLNIIVDTNLNKPKGNIMKEIFEELFPNVIQFEKYYGIITSQEIDYSVFIDLDKEILDEIGITAFGPKFKILKKIKELKEAK